MTLRNLQFTLSIDGTDRTEWVLESVDAQESIGNGPRARVAGVTREVVTPDELIGKPATLALLVREGEERFFHGVVLEASVEARREDAFRVEVEIGARIELLKFGRNHRIFQNKSVKDVVSAVLDEAGLSGEYEWSVRATYTPHENIVQYGESDFTFISRLLAEEGIAFAVFNDAAADKIFFFDSADVLEAIEGEANLIFRGAGTTNVETIADAQLVHSVASDAVMLRDYDFKRPTTDLSKTAEAPDSTSREVYLHPGGYVEESVGERLAKNTLERLRCKTLVVRGSSDAPRLEPGRKFSMVGHPRSELIGEYMVLEVTHHGIAPQGPSAAPHREASPSEDADQAYRCDFVAIPIDVPFRPEPIERPVMHGLQSAYVTCPGGEEIHADENGRVKVRFIWDRSGITDDQSSTWLRVGQLALGGSMVLPRGDFEVLVDYEMGDLDRPCVSGHLYNIEAAPPYAFPAAATRSSFQSATTGGGPGSNELRFEDTAGAEEMFLNASKDLTVAADNDSTWSVGVDEKCETTGNRSCSVVGSVNDKVVGNRSMKIGVNCNADAGGDYSDGVGGSLKIDISGARMVKVGGDHSENVTGALSRTVAALQSVTAIAGYDRKIGGSSTTNVTAAWTEVIGGSRMVSVTGTFIELIGALKFIKAKTMSVSTGAAYVVNAAAEIVKAGGARTDSAEGAIAVTAAGPLSVKAKDITFSASSKIVLRGGACSITLTSSGEVTLKAPTVILKNAKVLNQVMHKSN